MDDLNETERSVLKAIHRNIVDVGTGDFGFGNEVQYYVDDLEPRQVSGYVSQLAQKDYVTISELQEPHADQLYLTDKATEALEPITEASADRDPVQEVQLD